jgi:hypothetical protein
MSSFAESEVLSPVFPASNARVLTRRSPGPAARVPEMRTATAGVVMPSSRKA